MNHTSHFPGALLLLLAAAALSGCSPQRDARPAAHAPAAAPQNAPPAVARGKIEVEGGLLDLAPASAGVVRQLAVREGQQVSKGQLLLRLADDEPRAELGVAQSELQLAQTRARTRVARLPALRQTQERWAAAVHEGAADAQGLDEAAQALRDGQADAQVAEVEVAVARAKLEQLQTQLRRLELHAPEAGVVVRVAAQPGAPVTSSAPVVVLLPARPLLVRAELNESFVHAVRVGMRATVVADGDGGGIPPGLPDAKVLRISPVYGQAKLQDDPSRGPVRVVECLLAFDQPPQGARVGQNVRVTFHE